jgi:hypothetical protein
MVFVSLTVSSEEQDLEKYTYTESIHVEQSSLPGSNLK